MVDPFGQARCRGANTAARALRTEPENRIDGSSRAEINAAEAPLEQRVSEHIRALRFLALPVNDAPARDSLRGYIERNAIALLSNYNRAPLDAASTNRLRAHCDRE